MKLHFGYISSILVDGSVQDMPVANDTLSAPTLSGADSLPGHGCSDDHDLPLNRARARWLRQLTCHQSDADTWAMQVARKEEVGQRLRDAFVWRGRSPLADVSGWWADPEILREIGPALAQLHDNAGATMIVGPESYGFLLGPLVAIHLGVGFVEIKKGMSEEGYGDRVVSRTTPPDYKERDLVLGVRRRLLKPRDRVLFVDEWINTGAQAIAARAICSDIGCEFVGAAVIVDATDNRVRRDLNVRSLINVHELNTYE